MARLIEVAGDPGLVMASMPLQHSYYDPRLEEFARAQEARLREFMEYSNSNFMKRSMEIAEKLHSEEAVNRARRALEETGMVVDDYIYNPGWDGIFEAGMTMRRYIMANPRVFELYERNRISGYEDDVILEEENLPPEWRDDYLFAVDEVMDENGEITFVSLERENPLSISERQIIQDTWFIANEYLDNKIDPTDPNKGKL